jgi:hypothetical protein
MSKTPENPNQPRSLTTDQKLFLDQLVAKFEDPTNIKLSELTAVGEEISNRAYLPCWILRNLKLRNKNKRGRYDLSSLIKLPVVAFKEKVKTKKKKKGVKVSLPILTPNETVNIQEIIQKVDETFSIK